MSQRLLSFLAAVLALTAGPVHAAHSDNDIKGAVMQCIDSDPAIFDYDITVAVEKGIVTLTGRCGGCGDSARRSDFRASNESGSSRCCLSDE